jgi:acylphosphatase
MKVRARVFISGRVQAVFFRSQTRKESRKANVVGWVRNLSDGRVEAVFEGEEKDVKKLIEFCKRGPVGAKVDKTKILMEEYTGEFADFRIIW